MLEIAKDEDFDLPDVVNSDALIEASTTSTADAAPANADTAASDGAVLEKTQEWAKRLREHGLIMNVKQPWLHAILHCGKTVENRRAPFPHLALDGAPVEHRWVLLAASANDGSVKQWDEEMQKLRAAINADPAMDAAQREMAIASLPHHRSAYPRGAIVGLARVTTSLETMAVSDLPATPPRPPAAQVAVDARRPAADQPRLGHRQDHRARAARSLQGQAVELPVPAQHAVGAPMHGHLQGP